MNTIKCTKNTKIIIYLPKEDLLKNKGPSIVRQMRYYGDVEYRSYEEYDPKTGEKRDQIIEYDYMSDQMREFEKNQRAINSTLFPLMSSNSSKNDSIDKSLTICEKCGDNKHDNFTCLDYARLHQSNRYRKLAENENLVIKNCPSCSRMHDENNKGKMSELVRCYCGTLFSWDDLEIVNENKKSNKIISLKEMFLDSAEFSSYNSNSNSKSMDDSPFADDINDINNVNDPNKLIDESSDEFIEEINDNNDKNMEILETDSFDDIDTLETESSDSNLSIG